MNNELEGAHCRYHQEQILDRLCISETCKNPEQLICIECIDEHDGQPILIQKIIHNIEQSLKNSSSSDQKLAEAEKQAINNICEITGKFQDLIMKKIDDYQERALHVITSQFKQLRKENNELENISIKSVVQSITLQEKLIEFQLQKLNFIDIFDQCQNLEEVLKKHLIKTQDFIENLDLGENEGKNIGNNNQAITFKDFEFSWEYKKEQFATNTRYHMLKLNDSEILTINNPLQLDIIDISTGLVKKTLSGLSDWTIKDCLFQVSDKVMGTRCSDGKIHILNKDDSSLMQVLNLEEHDPDKYNNSCSFNRKHQMLISSIKNGVKNYGLIMFRLDEADQNFKLSSTQFKGFHEEKINNMIEFDSDTIISGSEDHTLKLWNLQTLNDQKLAQEPEGIVCVRQVNNQKIVYNRWDGTVMLYDMINQRQMRSFQTEPNQNVEKTTNSIFIMDVYQEHTVLMFKDLCKQSLQILNILTGEIELVPKKLRNFSDVVSSIIVTSGHRKYILLSLRDGLDKYWINN